MRAAICETLEKIGENSFVESSIVDDDGVSISVEAHGPLISPPAEGCLKLVSWYFYDESTYSIDTDDDEITILTKTHLGTKYLVGYRDGELIQNAENNDSDDWTGNMVSIMIGDATDENLDALAEVLTENETQGMQKAGFEVSLFPWIPLSNEKKIPIMLHMMQSSLVTQGRNLCVADFLNSECTHMLFIDSDILFKAESIIKMIEKNQEVLSIPYPMKNILWHKVLDKWRGIPSMNFEQASTCGNVFPIKIKNGTEDIDVIDDMVEFTHSTTGCMLIKRQAFDKMIKEYPDLTIHQDSIIDDKLVRKKNLYNFEIKK